ncbi:MAG: hypothetical protein Q4P15_01665 [Propionibacteriaceae bacterium]|nr:hypothetical protein [Propionibacteriaceae bacterium]
MADIGGTEGNHDPDAGNADAADEPTQLAEEDSTQLWTPEQDPAPDDTSMMMDDIFRPTSGDATEATPAVEATTVHEDVPPPVGVMPTEVSAVEAEVLDEPEPEPWWKSTWLIAVGALLIALAIGAFVWGSSRDDTTVKETPPMVATPVTTQPDPTEVTVTETANATATETKKIETTATQTSKVTSTETTKVKSTATETVKVESTETVKVPADPAPTVTLVVTDSPAQQNTQGLTVETATQACATAAETTLKSTYPDAEIKVPGGQALVSALRTDLDAWFIKVAATVDDTDRPVDCSVSGSEAAPSVDSVKVR